MKFSLESIQKISITLLQLKQFWFTGYYPHFSGLQGPSLRTLEPVGVPTKFKFLPAYLKDLGYQTHGVGKWHLGFCHPDYLPSNRGFDTFNGFWNGGADHYEHALMAYPSDPSTRGFDFHKNEDLDFDVIGTSTSRVVADRVGEIVWEHVGINKTAKLNDLTNYNASDPFFIYAAFQDPHMPLQVEEKYTNLYPDEQDPIRKNYLGMVSRLDEAVGQMLDDLKNITYMSEEDGQLRSLLDDTVIIFSSDNGGWSEKEFGYSGGSNLPLKGSKVDTLEGGTRVPGFIWNSGRKGSTMDLFHITDWLPTIYSGIAGGNAENLPGDMSGFNQADLLSNPDGKSMRDEVVHGVMDFTNTSFTMDFGQYMPVSVINMTGAYGGALRFEDWKIIKGCYTFMGCVQNYGVTEDPDVIQLYNLAEDPNETTDLSADPQYAEILQILKDRLQHQFDIAMKPLRADEGNAGSPVNMDPQVYYTGWCDSIYEAEPQ